jgi:hypothetical protein
MRRTVSEDAVVVERKPSPYVGPRAIREGESFHGREREARELRGELLSSGTILLHAPSGAGKTSLIQASLVPWCAQEHFQVCAAHTPRFSALRVNLPPPAELDVCNRYVFSLVTMLVGDRVAAKDAATMSIDEALSTLTDIDGTDGRQLVVVDQLEEVLTLDPSDRSGQEEFFRQLGNALRSSRRWALLAVRDDFLGGLGPYRRFFPNELRATFRLDFLDEDAAVRAIQGPAAREDVTFSDAAARRLVADLRRVRAAPVVASGEPPTDVAARQSPDEERLYPFVEPVLVQVVCNNLWRILSKKRLAEFTEIAEDDLKAVRPYHRALASYYRAAVRKAAVNDAGVERAVREWIEQSLLTRQLTRRATRTLPDVADRDAVVKRLVDRYLLREDPRPWGTFRELSHDLLVDPIVEDNRLWRLTYLEPWQVVADQWDRSERLSSLLLTGPALQLVREAAAKIDPSEVERAFLDESGERDDEQRTFRDHLSTLRFALIGSLLLNAVLLVALVFWRLAS